MLRLLGTLIEIYIVVLIARALMSWIPMRAGSPLLPVVRVLDMVTEPVLRPIRRLVPTARIGGIGLDFSFLILVIGLEIVASWMLAR